MNVGNKHSMLLALQFDAIIVPEVRDEGNMNRTLSS